VAFKMLKKYEILRLKQVDHIINENTILSMIEHPFLVMNSYHNYNRFKCKVSVKMKGICI